VDVSPKESPSWSRKTTLSAHQTFRKIRSIKKLAILAAMTIFLRAAPLQENKNLPLTWKKNKTEIQALEKAYAAAELAKDAAGVAAYYAEDAVSICIKTAFFMYIFFY
jgi:hypothetical protein